MHFAYNEKRKSATLSFAGRHSIVDMVNTIDDLLNYVSESPIAMELYRRADETAHPEWRVDPLRWIDRRRRLNDCQHLPF